MLHPDKKPHNDEERPMVNIYLFIELIRAASAPDVADRIKGMSLANCKFANVVVLSEEKLVAQLDCKDSTDGDHAILNKIAKVEGVVQTNIIAVVRPVKR
jgi:DNA-binding Lrp family transcriptional regulator